MRSSLFALLALPVAVLGVSVVNVPGTTYAGCYTDLQGALNNQRALAFDTWTSSQMTVSQCAARMARYAFFGVEYGTECYGANYITPGAVAAAASSCSTGCAGNSSQACGGDYRLNLYRNPVITPVYADPLDCSAAAAVAVTSTVTQTTTYTQPASTVTLVASCTQPASTVTVVMTSTTPAETVTVIST